MQVGLLSKEDLREAWPPPTLRRISLVNYTTYAVGYGGGFAAPVDPLFRVVWAAVPSGRRPIPRERTVVLEVTQRVPGPSKPPAVQGDRVTCIHYDIFDQLIEKVGHAQRARLARAPLRVPKADEQE